MARESQVRLRRGFIESILDSPRGWPKRDNFCRFFREELRLSASVERQWAPLRLGKPVDESIAAAFIGFMKARGFPDATVESCAIPHVEIPGMDEEGAWNTWQNVLSAVSSRFDASDAMYFHDPFQDALAAARIVMGYTGYSTAEPGEPLNEESCIARAPRHMNETLDGYALWLAAMWRHQFRSVMFAVSGKQSERVSVSVILPVTETAASQLSSGEIGVTGLMPADIPPQSKYLFLCAIAAPIHLQGLRVKEITEAQVHCALYQCAYFTRGLKPYRPVFLTIAGNPQYRKRLRRLGFRDVGTCLHGTDKPLVILRHPKESGRKSFKDWSAYKMLSTALDLYKIGNYRRWRDEDRED